MNKVLRSIVILILVILTLIMFTACSGESKIASIEVDQATVEDFYDVKDFDISIVYIIATFENEETERIPITMNMVRAEDQVKLLVAGEHNITVTYKQRTTTFTLKLREGIAGKFKVVFLNADGTQIGDIQYVSSGGSAASPTIPSKPDHIFDGWKDQRNNYTFYDNIIEDKIYTATFVPDFCTVKFILSSGVTIQEFEIKKGTNVSSLAPAFPVLPGFTAKGWNRSLDNITEDTTITAEYTQDTINVYYSFGDDGRQPKVVNYAANSMIQPSDSPVVNHAEFLGWYTNESFEGTKVTFPYLLKNEITFYAKYVSRTKGSDGLEYSYTGSNTYTVSGYNGDDDVIVVPEKYNNLDVVGIENRAFLNSKNTRFFVTASNNYFSITDGVLFDVNKEKLIAYPAGKLGEQYTLPVGVKSVENYAFANAKNLKLINYLSNQNLTTIGNYAFYNCINIIQMNIPRSVQTIGDYAFLMESDSNLTALTFAASSDLEQIGREAFRGLNKLGTITLPSNKLETIGSSVFYGCNQLRDILLEGNTSDYFSSVKGVLYDKVIKTLIAYPANNLQNLNAFYTVENNVETIKAGAFIYPNLVGVVLPSSIRSVEGFAFNSPRLQFIHFHAQTQPETLSSIMFGDYEPSFIIVPEGRALAYSYFSDMQIVEGSTETYYYNELTGYLYTKNADHKLTILGLRKQAEDLILPEKIDDFDVIKIGKYAFFNNKVIKTITVSEGIQTIDEYAFWKATALQQIVLPDTLEEIGRSAFSDCTSLTTITNNPTISLSKIGEEAFILSPWYENATIEFLTIGDVLISHNGNGIEAILPENIKVIADNAFIEKSNLTTIKLNDGLEKIGSYAFYGCSGIFYIEIPASVNYIGEYAFSFCSNLYRIIMLSNLPPELSSSGEVFTTNAAYYAGTEEYNFSILVPYNSNSLVLNAYKNHELWGRYNLLHLNERQTTFSSGASKQDEVTANVIYEPKPPLERPGYVFAGWFYNENLSYQMNNDPIIFPQELQATVEFNARWYNENQGSNGIEYVLINDDTEYAVFRYTGSLKYVVIPNAYKGKPVTKILSGAFSTAVNPINADVYKILLPTTITAVDEGAFNQTKWYEQFLGDFVYINDVLVEYRGNVESLVVPAHIKYLVQGAFRNNLSLKRITLPNNINILPAELFYNASNLTEVVLPTSLFRIDERAFMNCTSLKTINFPSMLDDIAPSAFTNSKWLNSYIDDVVVINSVLYQYKGKQKSLHIPNTVTKIEDEAFKNNIFLENVYVPNTVVIIGTSSFEGCINIINVQFNEGTAISSIGERAFYGCLMMENFNLGDNRLLEIHDYAFSYCSRLISADLPATLRYLGKGAYSESGIIYLNLAGRGVLAHILEDTFKNSRNLKVVVFGDNTTLQSIASSAFENCGNLMTVTIPDTNRYLTKIDVKAFYNCVSLTSVVLPTSLMEIGDDAFANSPYLDSNNDVIMTVGSVLLKYAGNDSLVFLSKEIAAISKGAFKDNNTLIKVVFEEGSKLFAIGEEAFMNCAMLEEIVFPLTLISIGNNALLNTKWLNEYVDDYVIINNILIKYKGNEYQAKVPNNVNIIGIDAFNGNTRLRNIELSNNISKIEARAFDNMSPGSTITMLKTTPPELHPDNEIVSTIYVENNLVLNNYRENESWSRFVNNASQSIIIKYEIQFNLVYEGATIDIPAIEVNAMFTEPVPYLVGYTFIGWYETFNNTDYKAHESGAYGESLITLPYYPTSNTILYAKWIENATGTDVGDLRREILTPVGFDVGTYLTAYTGFDRYVMVPIKHSDYQIIGISKSLEGNAFAGNTTIEEVVFMQGYYLQLKYILEGAFEGATNLRRIVLPSTLEYIGPNAFRGCTNLEEVIFTGGANGIVIDENAFEGCSSLKTITFPATTTSIGENAFKNCPLLTTIYMNGDVPPQGNTPFEIIIGMRIYVNRSIDDTIVASYKAQWALYEQYIYSKPL